MNLPLKHIGGRAVVAMVGERDFNVHVVKETCYGGDGGDKELPTDDG